MPNLPKQPRPHDEQSLRRACADELTAARRARISEDAVGEWRHLERAHVLSQPLPGAHLRTHAAMLGYGLRHRDRHEVLGQVARLLVAGPGSAARRYPLGNTGGADVSAVEPMPIPDDLQAILDGALERAR
jgi:hypothetical protein